MATPPIITHGSIGKMLSLLDYCYRIGVEAAYALQDEGLAREFIERTKEAGVYGILSDSPIYTTWQEWGKRIIAQARSTAWSGTMVRFFSKAGAFGANFLSAFYPVSFFYYTRGIEDYLNAPEAVDYNIFAGKTRVRWTKKGLRKIKPQEYVDDIQLYCYDLERRDEVIREANESTPSKFKKITLSPRQYESFRNAVGLAAQKKY